MLPSKTRFLPLLLVSLDSVAPAGAFAGHKVPLLRRRMTILAAGADKAISVAVIGGGVAGLSCASALSKSDAYVPTVFDTGRLRPGGRCSSRLPGDASKNSNDSKSSIIGGIVVDHAAQILSVPKEKGFESFQKQVKQWEEDGVVRRFPEGAVVEILPAARGKENNGFRSNPLKADMYYGNGGMNAVPEAIAASGNSFEIQQDVWVSPGNGVRFIGDKGKPRWQVKRNGKVLGTYDRLIIAHNGKCADRLMSKTPAKKLHSLLRTNFSPTVPKHGGKRMTLNSIYSYTFAIKKDSSPLSEKLGEEVISCFIKNEPKLRFLTCQTRKEHKGQIIKNNNEVWTVLSSPTFAKKFKGPQENLSDETVEEVKGLLLQALESSLDLPSGSLSKNIVLDSKLQLWGAAVPLNVWKSNSTDSESFEEEGFLYDNDFGVGTAGDWLLDPSLGGAWTSGLRLAEYMIGEKHNNVGLPPNGSFVASRAAHEAGIGSVK